MHEHKEEVLYQYFSGILGAAQFRNHSISPQALDIPSFELQQLEEEFSEQEIHKVLNQMPREKVPVPDVFSGLFYKSCWDTIKQDLMNVLAKLHQMNEQNFELLNN